MTDAGPAVPVLVADLGATKMLSLEGLQALLLVRAAAARRGAQLRLASLRPHVRVKMELTGTVRLFSLYDTVEQACAGYKP
jgi:anti-sigma B factor antagonist